MLRLLKMLVLPLVAGSMIAGKASEKVKHAQQLFLLAASNNFAQCFRGQRSTVCEKG